MKSQSRKIFVGLRAGDIENSRHIFDGTICLDGMGVDWNNPNADRFIKQIYDERVAQIKEPTNLIYYNQEKSYQVDHYRICKTNLSQFFIFVKTFE